MKCDFCGVEGDWKNVIVSNDFWKKDGSDVVVCDECLNDFAHGEYDKLTKKMKARTDIPV